MLSFQQAADAIERFNVESGYPAGDAVVRAAFLGPADSIRHLSRVVLLNSLFYTNLGRSKPTAGRDRKSLQQISDAIRSKLPEIDKALISAGVTDVMQLGFSVESIRETITGALDLVISCCDNASLSFAAKYLHFYRPYVFAPWDKYVPTQTKRMFQYVWKGLKTYADRYVRLLEAYQLVWWGYSADVQSSLIEQDFETQPIEWKCRNSPLRIIDKILWKLGKEETEESKK